MSELSTEEELRHSRWKVTALCIGYNELAKQMKVLGDKVYFRLLRDAYVEELEKLGGSSPFKQEPSIMEIEVPDFVPRIKFREQDIEMMRQCVADYDAQSVKVEK